VERNISSFAVALGAVHGNVGIAEQDIGLFRAAVAHRHSHADSDHQVTPANREGPAEFFGNCRRDRQSVGLA
jgi:hypothetical protein